MLLINIKFGVPKGNNWIMQSCDKRKFARNVCIKQHAQIVTIWLLILLLMTEPFVLSKRRLKSQYGGRTVFNLITQFDLKYKETTWLLSLTSVQNKQKINCDNLEINWKLTSWLPPYLYGGWSWTERLNN